jgi:RNA-directed DNA polymerase
MNDASPQTLGILSVRHLAAILRIDVAVLRLLARDANALYAERHKYDKKRHKYINIEEPQGRLKDVQERLVKRLINSLLLDDPVAYGSVRGRGALLAAQVLAGKPLLITVDISDFYGHVTFRHVYETFCHLKCSHRVADIIARLTTRNGRLPKGAPSSPAISNLVMLRFDKWIDQAAHTRGVSICRYIDDIGIGGERNGPCDVLNSCIRSLHALGLPVHRRRKMVDGKKPKLRFQERGGSQEVLGLNVCGKVPVIPREYSDNLRSQIRQKKRFCGTEREMNSLRGKIAYLRTTNPNRAEKFQQLLSSCPVIDNR